MNTIIQILIVFGTVVDVNRTIAETSIIETPTPIVQQQEVVVVRQPTHYISLSEVKQIGRSYENEKRDGN